MAAVDNVTTGRPGISNQSKCFEISLEKSWPIRLILQWSTHTLHVVVICPDLVVSGLQLLLEGLVFIQLGLSLLHG